MEKLSCFPAFCLASPLPSVNPLIPALQVALETVKAHQWGLCGRGTCRCVSIQVGGEWGEKKTPLVLECTSHLNTQTYASSPVDHKLTTIPFVFQTHVGWFIPSGNYDVHLHTKRCTLDNHVEEFPGLTGLIPLTWLRQIIERQWLDEAKAYIRGSVNIFI